jgi:hypothetical protein
VRVAVLMLGVLLLLLLQAIELWRRLRDPAALTAGQFWRRIFTAAVLQVVLLMWLAGNALMRHQSPLTQMAYWTAALLFGIAAAFLAVREMGEVSRQANRQRAELFRGFGSQALEETRGAGEGESGRSNDRIPEA